METYLAPSHLHLEIDAIFIHLYQYKKQKQKWELHNDNKKLKTALRPPPRRQLVLNTAQATNFTQLQDIRQPVDMLKQTSNLK